MSQTSSSSGSVGFIGLLTIVFITLKLMGHIRWSWVWVLSPVWITASLIIVITFLACVVFALRLMSKN
ncbi:MAG: hypothetical protein MSG64_19770 [Pyrinomonadaceae bacterium MAG19_C2-C3]|nr:hypothetical protein [Pyrinomonadaceae bacterium MAG19_C2-C3]